MLFVHLHASSVCVCVLWVIYDDTETRSLLAFCHLLFAQNVFVFQWMKVKNERKKKKKKENV